MNDRIDILLYVALSEEADSVLNVLGSDFKPKEFKDANLTAFYGTLAGPSPDRNFNVAMVPAGKMGNTHAASVVSMLIEKFKPSDVVVIGIAGSLSNDMEPGDVFIPDSVNEYLANSAAYGEGENWKFQISTNRFLTSRRLLNRFQVFSLANKDKYQSWQDSTSITRSTLISTETDTALKSAGLEMRGFCKLHAGNDLNLASGPAVGKGKAFTDWVRREVDRKAAAIEMETAGVYDAALVPTYAPRTIAIRGISDYADARKEKIESTAEGMFRELSAKNAVSLFVHAVKAGLFETEDSKLATSSGVSDPKRLDSFAKSVFVLGGETGETHDIDAERPRLHRASLKLGAALARGGAHLIVCSPFPDSADYYVAMGYSDENTGGSIHFHSPIHQKTDEKRTLFRKLHGKPNLTVQDWNYPTPDTDTPEAWSQAWLLAQLQALEKADVVVALGGKVSKNASTLLHLAEAKGLPIIPFAFLGGAAGRTYQRRNWADLNPSFDASVLNIEDKVEQVVSIANQLVGDRVKRSLTSGTQPQSIFISVARLDAKMGDALEGEIKSRGINAVLGDNEIGNSQLITATIENALRSCDIIAVLWSRSYAQSPWCYDELSLALNLEALGEIKIWLFNLDDSSIVPTPARKFPAISVRSLEGLQKAISELLS